MIFWFSGTGNSLFAAQTIAKAQNERLVSIAEELDKKDNSFTYEFAENELIGFAWPVYAWAPPALVKRFIGKMKITGKPFAFSVSTCGAEEGHATAVIEKELEAKGVKLSCAISLAMPSNYIIGSDVYPKEAEDKMLLKAGEKLKEFNAALSKRQEGYFELLPGKMPALLTTLVNPLFNRFAIKTGSFYATDACNGCGLCERICPLHTIKVTEKPAWGKACTQCLACINRCPCRAIEFGKSTLSRGRYVHPCLKP